MCAGGTAGVVAQPAVGLTGGCAVGITKIADYYTGAVWAIFIALAA